MRRFSAPARPAKKAVGKFLSFPRIVALVAAVAIAGTLAGGGALAATSPEPAPETASASAAKVVKVKRIVPRRTKVRRVRFKPYARASKARVKRMIRIEAKRWKISPSRLSRRVACESGYRWWADGGPYHGLLQFAPSTFVRGMRSIRTRSVVIVRKRYRRVRETKVIRYSNGRVVRRKGRARRQKLVRISRGRLPRRPGVTHAWAQLRIGSQAIRGLSAVRSSEWGCPA